MFEAPTEKLFRYMSAGGHPHIAFKSHRLVSVIGSLVTVEAEVFNPDGSTFQTTIKHTLEQPSGVETTMTGGAVYGAKVTHAHTPVGEHTKVELEGDFSAFARLGAG